MKMFRNALVVVGMCAMFLAIPFAVNGYSMCGMCDAGKSGKDMKEACKAMTDSMEAKIKILRDSAAALQGTNPDLAKGLNDIADQKAKKLQECAEKKAMHDAKTKLLADSAVALKQSNPALSKELQDMSEYKHKGKGSEKKEAHDDDKD